MLATWRNSVRLGPAFHVRIPKRWRCSVRTARWPRQIQVAAMALAIGFGGGCSQASKLARSSSPPAAAPPDPFGVPSTYRPTGLAGPPINNGQARGPETIGTPRPDSPSPGQPVTPLCPPGAPRQGFGPAPPPAKPARRWRGFLPAQGTDEDRPGWWTPDYGGGTSA